MGKVVRIEATMLPRGDLWKPRAILDDGSEIEVDAQALARHNITPAELKAQGFERKVDRDSWYRMSSVQWLNRRIDEVRIRL